MLTAGWIGAGNLHAGRLSGPSRHGTSLAGIVDFPSRLQKKKFDLLESRLPVHFASTIGPTCKVAMTTSSYHCRVYHRDHGLD
jgi:hypothetical protein